MTSLRYKLLCCLVLIVLFAQPLFVLFQVKDTFFSKGYSKIYPLLRSSYYSSQYVQKKNPKIIPDDTFEAFAGGFFLRGGNPILITHDQPPLGRYLIALSIILFDNAKTITIITLVFSGIGIFLISRMVLKNFLLSLIPIAILINEPLFLSKLNYAPLLEPIQLPFIIFSLYFFIKGLVAKNYLKWFIWTSIMLGFVISTRFFILGGAMLVSMLITLLYSEKRINKKIIMFTICLPISLIILITSYFVTLAPDYNFFKVFGIQKYILYYQKSKFVLLFSFWDLLLFNRWHTWWGSWGISSDPQWIILWPISAILTFLYGLANLFRKMSFSIVEIAILSWVIIYCAMLSSGYTSTRYFLPLLPFLYILSLSFLVKLYRLIVRKKGPDKT